MHHTLNQLKILKFLGSINQSKSIKKRNENTKIQTKFTKKKHGKKNKIKIMIILTENFGLSVKESGKYIVL